MINNFQLVKLLVKYNANKQNATLTCTCDIGIPRSVVKGDKCRVAAKLPSWAIVLQVDKP